METEFVLSLISTVCQCRKLLKPKNGKKDILIIFVIKKTFRMVCTINMAIQFNPEGILFYESVKIIC
jgi:hypothetical protein